MKLSQLRSALKAVLLGTAFIALQACAPATKGSSSHLDVAKAFETSDALAFKPYTRTIFSSNDF